MKKLLLLYCLTLLLSCTKSVNEKVTKDTISTKEISIDQFLQNFKKVNLPITFKACGTNESGLKNLSGENYRSYMGNASASVAYRQINTNGNYFATISFAVGDCYIPVLTTYDKSGKIIDQKTIIVGYCGSDCGYSCEEYMAINPDFTIFTSDTISNSQCDSLGNIIPETTHNYLIYKKGKLNTDGTINLSDEIKEDLNK